MKKVVEWQQKETEKRGRGERSRNRREKKKKKKKGRAKKGSAGRRYMNKSPSVLICDFTYSGGGERNGCRQ